MSRQLIPQNITAPVISFLTNFIRWNSLTPQGRSAPMVDHTEFSAILTFSFFYISSSRGYFSSRLNCCKTLSTTFSSQMLSSLGFLRHLSLSERASFFLSVYRDSQKPGKYLRCIDQIKFIQYISQLLFELALLDYVPEQLRRLPLSITLDVEHALLASLGYFYLLYDFDLLWVVLDLYFIECNVKHFFFVCMQLKFVCCYVIIDTIQQSFCCSPVEIKWCHNETKGNWGVYCYFIDFVRVLGILVVYGSWDEEETCDNNKKCLKFGSSCGYPCKG